MKSSTSEPLHGQPDGAFWAALPGLVHSLTPLFRAWGRTWDTRVEGLDYLRAARRAGSGLLLGTWHGNLSGFVHTLRDKEIVALVSPVYEGELIAQWLSAMGYELIRGSSNHQSAEGLRSSIRVLRDGKALGTVVDGPEGPEKIVKQGVIAMAQLSGLPILPGLAAGRRSVRFPTWDRHELPLPFTRVLFRFGEPLYVPRDLDRDGVEEYRARLERRLIELDESLRCTLKGMWLEQET